MLMHTREGATIVTQQEKLKTKPDNRWIIYFKGSALFDPFCCREICNGQFSFSHRTSQAEPNPLLLDTFFKVRHFPGKIDNKPRTKTDKLFSSLEAFTFKLHGKTVSTILVNYDFCQIAWLAWFNSGTHIKYDRICQQSITIISIEKSFSLLKSAQKETFFLEFLFKRKLLMSSI